MAKKTITDPIIDELKKLLVEGKVTFGADKTLTGLRKGTVSRVYLAANFPLTKKEDILHFAQMTGAEVLDLSVPNDELGIICKKPFSVSVLSIQK